MDKWVEVITQNVYKLFRLQKVFWHIVYTVRCLLFWSPSETTKQSWVRVIIKNKYLQKIRYYVRTKSKISYQGQKKTYSQVKTLNFAYPNRHIDIKIPHGSGYHVILQHTVQITLNLDNESTNKTRSIVNNVGRVLVKKKLLMLGSKEIDTINISDIYDTFKDFYMNEKEHEKNLSWGIESERKTGLFQVSSKIPYGRKEDLVEMLEFNFYEKVIFCSGDATAIRRLLNTSRIWCNIWKTLCNKDRWVACYMLE